MRFSTRYMQGFFSLAVLWIISGPIVQATAAPVVINFENFNLGGQPFINLGPDEAFTNVGGSGVNVTIIAGQTQGLRIYDLFQFSGAITGQALIDWPFPSGTNPNGTIILFDSLVSNFSLRAGDFGSEDDSPLMITAFDAGNNVIGSDSEPWPASANPPFATLSVNATGIRKVLYHSGGSFENSTFIDDLTFTPGGQSTPIPEPSTITLFGLGTLGLLCYGWQRSKRAASTVVRE